MSDKFLLWGLVDRDGRLCRWPLPKDTRAGLMSEASMYCMGAGDYERLGNDSRRWALLYRRGYRAVRVVVTVTRD